MIKKLVFSILFLFFNCQATINEEIKKLNNEEKTLLVESLKQKYKILSKASDINHFITIVNSGTLEDNQGIILANNILVELMSKTSEKIKLVPIRDPGFWDRTFRTIFMNLLCNVINNPEAVHE